VNSLASERHLADDRGWRTGARRRSGRSRDLGEGRSGRAPGASAPAARSAARGASSCAWLHRRRDGPASGGQLGRKDEVGAYGRIAAADPKEDAVAIHSLLQDAADAAGSWVVAVGSFVQDPSADG
jgi:hypothetical protein